MEPKQDNTDKEAYIFSILSLTKEQCELQLETRDFSKEDNRDIVEILVCQFGPKIISKLNLKKNTVMKGIFQALGSGAFQLNDLPERFWKDKKAAKLCSRVYPLSLYCASDEVRSDIELMFKVSLQNIECLNFVHKSLVSHSFFLLSIEKGLIGARAKNEENNFLEKLPKYYKSSIALLKSIENYKFSYFNLDWFSEELIKNKKIYTPILKSCKFNFENLPPHILNSAEDLTLCIISNDKLWANLPDDFKTKNLWDMLSLKKNELKEKSPELYEDVIKYERAFGLWGEFSDKPKPKMRSKKI